MLYNACLPHLLWPQHPGKLGRPAGQPKQPCSPSGTTCKVGRTLRETHNSLVPLRVKVKPSQEITSRCETKINNWLPLVPQLPRELFWNPLVLAANVWTVTLWDAARISCLAVLSSAVRSYAFLKAAHHRCRMFYACILHFYDIS